MARFAKKYRPSSLAQVGLPSEALCLLKELIDTDCVHILITGDVGVGKTTILDAVVKEVHRNDFDTQLILDVNSLQEKSCSSHKELLHTFCKAPMTNPRRIVLIDNADTLSLPIQEAIRCCMDTYGHKVNFIASCTHVSGMSPSFVHRLIRVHRSQWTMLARASLLEKICENEGIQLSDSAKRFVLDSAEGIRDVIQQLEKISLYGGTATLDIARACFSRIRPRCLDRLTELARLSDGGYSLAKAMYELYDQGHSAMDLLDSYLLHIKHSLSPKDTIRLIPIISKAARMNHGVQENEITLAITAKEMSDCLSSPPS